MKPSVTVAISRAWDWMRYVLFRPFDMGKWCALGFCAFLVMLGQGQGVRIPSFNYRGKFPKELRSNEMSEVLAHARRMALDHLDVIVVIVTVVVLVVLVLGVLFIWLSSRGTFMFLDGVVRNRGAVVEPWHKYRRYGNSLFWFKLAFTIAAMLLFLAVVVPCVVVAWPDIKAWQFTSRALAVSVTGGILLFMCSVVTWVVKAILHDFIPLIMCKRQVMVLAAWSIFFRELLPGRFWSFVCFYLMNIVLNIGFGIAVIAICCVTCCIAALALAIPYVGTVVLLPMLVFDRSYSALFLDQCGPEWRIFGPEAWPA